MLIQTPVKLNDIVTLKMVGGDEVIGKLINEHTDNDVKLSKPLLVMMGQQGFGLVPYILTAAPDAPAKLDRGHVITLVKTYDQVAKEYVKQTTGLIV